LKVEVNASLDADQIGALATSGAGGGLTIESGRIIEGLTILPKLDYELTVKMEASRRRNRHACGRKT